MRLITTLKYLLVEEMKSIMDDWRINTKLFDTVYGVPISEDDITGDVLYLFVGFSKNEEYMEYSYSFMLIDKNNVPKTKYLLTRNEVKPFLPKEKSLIFPLIKELTRKLLNTMLPEKILRRTIEPNTELNLRRYDEITDIMVNEYGYILTHKKETDSQVVWVLTKNNLNEENLDMEDNYEIVYNTTLSDRLNKQWAWIPEQIRKDALNKKNGTNH